MPTDDRLPNDLAPPPDFSDLDHATEDEKNFQIQWQFRDRRPLYTCMRSP